MLLAVDVGVDRVWLHFFRAWTLPNSPTFKFLLSLQWLRWLRFGGGTVCLPWYHAAFAGFSEHEEMRMLFG